MLYKGLNGKDFWARSNAKDAKQSARIAKGFSVYCQLTTINHLLSLPSVIRHLSSIIHHPTFISCLTSFVFLMGIVFRVCILLNMLMRNPSAMITVPAQRRLIQGKL